MLYLLYQMQHHLSPLRVAGLGLRERMGGLGGPLVGFVRYRRRILISPSSDDPRSQSAAGTGTGGRG